MNEAEPILHLKIIRDVELQNSVLLDEMGIFLGLRRTHTRSTSGNRALPNRFIGVEQSA